MVRTVFLALIPLSVLSQSAPPAFIRPGITQSIHAMRLGTASDRLEIRSASMLDLIRTAWRLDAQHVLGGPEWLELDRFDLVAPVPPGAQRADVLKAILQDRFQLAARQSVHDFPAYSLTLSSSQSLQPADPSETTGCHPPPGRNVSPYSSETVVLQCRNITLAQFAADLPKLRGVSGYLFNVPVMDRANNTAAWNFELRWSPRLSGPVAITPPSDQITLFDALAKVGLDLKPAAVPQPVLVVESVSRKPTANPRGVTEQFPEPPTQFEVAVIKLATPDNAARGASVNIQHGGRVHIVMTLKELLQEAYIDLNSDFTMGLPKSSENTAFDIVAKMTAPELEPGPAVFNGSDIDTMRLMLRGLLKERFGLVAHTEEHLIPGYVLVATKPKLRKADSSHRPSCHEGPGPDNKDPRLSTPLATRLITCNNMTLQQYAAALHDAAGDYLERYPPIADETRLPGSYDLTVNYSPPRALKNTAVPQPDGTVSVSDPNGAISLFQALEHQLGLKLESRKVKGQILVIDHIRDTPNEN